MALDFCGNGFCFDLLTTCSSLELELKLVPGCCGFVFSIFNDLKFLVSCSCLQLGAFDSDLQAKLRRHQRFLMVVDKLIERYSLALVTQSAHISNLANLDPTSMDMTTSMRDQWVSIVSLVS